MEEEEEGEWGGTTLWRKRGRGVLTPCGGRGRAGEGWYNRVEEEGDGERCGVQCHLQCTVTSSAVSLEMYYLYSKCLHLAVMINSLIILPFFFEDTSP